MSNLETNIVQAVLPAKAKDFLSGYKTYICAAVIAATGAAEALGYTVPGWVYALEGALGLGAMRVAISKNGAPYQAPPN